MDILGVISLDSISSLYSLGRFTLFMYMGYCSSYVLIPSYRKPSFRGFSVLKARWRRYMFTLRYVTR